MNNLQELKTIVKIDETQFDCNLKDDCGIKVRSLSYAVSVSIPGPVVEFDEFFKECCYSHVVFADVNSSKRYRNDFTSFYYQKQLSNETVEFVLLHVDENEEYELNDDTFGRFFPFGFFEENINFSGVLIEWKKVLEEIGEGSFKIVKKTEKIGISTEYPSMTYNLKQFSTKYADKTVRIDAVMNGKLENSKIDFTGLGWKSSIRVPGFFGRRNPNYEEDFIVAQDFEKRQISMKQQNEYKFQTNMIPDCLTDEILDFYLFADDIYMNDYNLNNHSYKFNNFGVKFATNEGTEYFTGSRKAIINLNFTDKFENNLKRNYK